MRILFCLKFPKIQCFREHYFSLTKTNGWMERERERDNMLMICYVCFTIYLLILEKAETPAFKEVRERPSHLSQNDEIDESREEKTGNENLYP